MEYPESFTTDEWNLLQWLLEYNHMDGWCELRCSKHGYDYFFDSENDSYMSLHRGLRDICEGTCLDDIKEYDGDGVKIWNGLVDKFDLNEYTIK